MKTLHKRLFGVLIAYFCTFYAGITLSSAQQVSRSPSARMSGGGGSNANSAERGRSGAYSHRDGGRASRASQASYNNQYERSVAPGASGQTLEPIPLEQFSHELDMAGAIPMAPTGSCDTCGTTGVCGCDYLGCLFDWSRAEFWLGLASFTGPANFATTGSNSNGQVEGSFGFQQGFNFASRVPCLLRGQLGAQIGMRFTQTQLDGSAAGPDNRHQAFLTAGLFRRVDYGLQGGLVVDYAHNEWLYAADLLQLRGELSFLFSPCHDFGFRFTNNQQTENTTATIAGDPTPVPLEVSALNTYRFFYRHRFGDCIRGTADWQLGWTEDEGTILGADFETPLHDQIGLRVNALYLIPSSSLSEPYTNEAWNIGLALVWTPGRPFGTQRDYYRPLFDVADNGSLLSRLNE